MPRQFTFPVPDPKAASRFWAKVQTGPGCWLWLGAKNASGYGRFKVSGQTVYAHRFAWLLKHGEAIAVVTHTCENRACVNPAHLRGEGDAAPPTTKRSGKPTKPRPDFPLFPHASGRWAKKVRGEFVYFGKIEGDEYGDAALAKWMEEKDALLAGRKRRVSRDGLTVSDLLNLFLASREQKLDAGELSRWTWIEYRSVCEKLVDSLGRNRLASDLGPDDFQALRATLAKKLGPVALGVTIQRMRTPFNWAYEAGHIDRPIRFGPDFTKPSRKTVRLARHASGTKMIEADELRTIIEAAGVPLRAMALLALNGGLGNHDIATLPLSAVNLQTGWLDHPRPKTGIARKIPLWWETCEAVTAAIEKRPKPKDKADAGLLFITKQGMAYVRAQRSKKKEDADDPKAFVQVDTINPEFKKVAKALDMNRDGLGFYSLRHTFRTVADEARDQPAVDALMGHDDGSMANRYRERISDSRLQAVVDHVRAWLWPSALDQNMQRP